jgi:hypothetical protein
MNFIKRDENTVYRIWVRNRWTTFSSGCSPTTPSSNSTLSKCTLYTQTCVQRNRNNYNIQSWLLLAHFHHQSSAVFSFLIILTRNFNKAADVAVSAGCGSKCRIDLLCNMVTTDFSEQVRCKQIQHRIFRIKSVNLLALRLYRFRSCLLRNMKINPIVRLNQLRLCLARYVSGEY